jgi:RNA polymerase sigma factor (sigma-70 family)
MDTWVGIEKTAELALVRAVVRGDPRAWETFVQRYSDLVYSHCSAVFSHPELEKEYLKVFRHLQSDDYAILRAFDGRSTFSTYLHLKLRELFAGRVLALFKQDAGRAWEAFQNCFNGVLEPLRKHNEDLYQDVCVCLIEDGYRRIVSFDGRGSFAGYIRRVIDNLCSDMRRKSAGRRRLPEAVKRLPLLAQQVYRQLYWHGSREHDLADILRDENGNPYARAYIKQALDQLRNTPLRQSDPPIRELPLLFADGEGGAKEMEIVDADHAPETVLLKSEQRRSEDEYIGLLSRAIDRLPAESALYLRLRFYSDPPKSPREMTRLMGRSEHEIYRIRRQTISLLRAALQKSTAVQNENLSVQGQ